MREQHQHKRWHGTQAWRNRAALQLRVQPLCAMCSAQGKTTAAFAADHVIPHHGDSYLFWFGELQSLCESHHNASKQQIELKGYSNEIGADGYPVDLNHPFHKSAMK